MTPYEILKNINNKSVFSKCTNYELESSYYFINKILGIKYPFIANKFNNYWTNGADVVRYWHIQLKNISNLPEFFWTKFNKKKVEETKDIYSIIKEYSDIYKIPYKDCLEKYTLFGKEFIDFIKQKLKEIKEIKKE